MNIWDSNFEGTTQSNLIVAPYDSTLSVDDLRVAQFLYTLVGNEYVRDLIDTLSSRVVLLLGRFSEEGLELLESLRAGLRVKGLCPVIFDFDGPRSRTTLETVTTLARLSKVVIADISDPHSVPQELLAIVESLPSVRVLPLIHEEQEPWGMFDHIARYPWVEEPVVYARNKEGLESLRYQVEKFVARETLQWVPRNAHHLSRP